MITLRVGPAFDPFGDTGAPPATYVPLPAVPPSGVVYPINCARASSDTWPFRYLMDEDGVRSYENGFPSMSRSNTDTNGYIDFTLAYLYQATVPFTMTLDYAFFVECTDTGNGIAVSRVELSYFGPGNPRQTPVSRGFGGTNSYSASGSIELTFPALTDPTLGLTATLPVTLTGRAGVAVTNGDGSEAGSTSFSFSLS